ncbi:serine/threonine-protein phosphatase 6 regulatory ankyrin repeat subunit B [Halyomorpha halys]|uniref:serine/threonine-protein phosphatase 6 regulatory ankyrin repeat subunit B n=1 Tax=Halyomorpha halys TaxID=286706 RepID=UPI0006D50B81|nr:serine/threonine-protein phosphatase 6 regulatory ankyrin repeat subunit B-like [Halyomorpha halys]
MFFFLLVSKLVVFSSGHILLLNEAVFNGKATEVIKLLEAGTFLESRDDRGRTPLHIAAKCGYDEIVELLLKFGGRLSARDDNGNSPLHIAVINKHTKCVKRLLQGGADTNAVDSAGCNSLHFATRNCHVKAIKILIDQGIDLNAGDNYGNTPLHYAVCCDNIRALIILIQSGALKTTKNHVGRTAIAVAAQCGNIGTFKALLDQNNRLYDPEIIRDNFGNSLLHLAISSNKLSVAKYLIDQLGADTETKNNFLRTPLHNCSELGLYAAVKFLITRGADAEALDAATNKPSDLTSNPSIIDLLGNKSKIIYQPMNSKQLNCTTDLHSAIMSRNITVVLNFFKEHRKYRHEDNCPTPVQLAATTCQLDMLKYLTEQGEEIDVKFQGGVTLSHLALLPSNKELMEKGIHVDDLLQPPLWEECPGVSVTPLKSTQELNYPGYTLLDGNCGMDLLVTLKELKINIDKTDNFGRSPLHYAAKFGNIKAVLFLLDLDVKIDIKDKVKKTPLYIAVEEGHTEIVKLLIKRNASINIYTEHKWFPVHAAAKHGHLQVMDILIKAGADIHSKSQCYERMPLHQAVWYNKTEIISLLIKQGVDINCPDLWGRSSLHLASEKGHTKIVLQLLSAGANIDAKMRERKTPAIVSIESNQLDILKVLLVHGADVHQMTQDRRSLLHIAAKVGNPQIILLVMCKGLNVNSKDSIDKTPLYNAAECGCPQAMVTLLDAGADPSILTQNKETILHAAASSGNENATFLALRYIKDINARNVQGQSSLYRAAFHGHINIFQLLLDKGADLSLRNIYNETLLHFAAISNNDLLVKKLVQNMSTAEINLQDSQGKTALYRAAVNGRYGTFQILYDKGGDPNIGPDDGFTLLHWAAQSGNVHIIQNILERVRSVNAIDRKGRTALYITMEFGRDQAYFFFLKKGIRKVEGFRTIEGRTLLHGAVIGGSTRIITDHLKSKQDLDIQDSDGRTPMFMACGLGRKNVYDILLTAGASLNARTNDGRTVLHAAAFGGNVAIVESILKMTRLINARDSSGRSPIFYAAERSKRDVFNCLVTREAGLHYTTEGGWTLLHAAAKGGDPNIVETIISHMKDINLRDIKGYTSLQVAMNTYCCKGQAFLRLIMRGADPNIADNEGTTILHKAAHYGEIFLAQSVLNITNKSINALDNYERTPLHWAVYFDQIDIVTLLLKFKADPHIENTHGYTPLTLVAAMGSLGMIKLFSHYEYSGEAMLGIALAWGNRDIILYLLENKIIPIENNKVHFAAARGDDEELEILLAHNISTNGQNFTELMKEIVKEYRRFTTKLEEDEVEIINPLDFNLTPLDMAIFFNGSSSTVNILLKKLNIDLMINDRSRWTPLDIAAFCGKETLVRNLIAKGVKVDFPGQDSWTAMHKAAWGGHSTIIDILYHNNADINRRDVMERTPLHIAAMRGYNTSVNTIIQLNMDSLNMRDRYDFTPLHLAEIFGHQKFFEILEYTSITIDPQDRYRVRDPGLIHSKLRNHTRTIELLLEKGANVDMQDKAFGWSALHWSAAIGHLEVAKMLVKYGAKINLPSRINQTPMYLARLWGRNEIYYFLQSQGGVW